MLLMKRVRLSIGPLLAADLGNLADFLWVKLAKANFVAEENLSLDDMVEATFPGYDLLQASANVQETGIDTTTGKQMLTVSSPIGGWRWKSTAAPTVPETIFGFYVANQGIDPTPPPWLVGVQLFEQPIVIANAGDEVIIPAIKFAIAISPFE